MERLFGIQVHALLAHAFSSEQMQLGEFHASPHLVRPGKEIQQPLNDDGIRATTTSNQICVAKQHLSRRKVRQLIGCKGDPSCFLLFDSLQVKLFVAKGRYQSWHLPCDYNQNNLGDPLKPIRT